MKKIALYNIKGGVGKSTTSVNLACLMAKKGLSVLIWDLDPQGGSSYFFEKTNSNNHSFAKLFGDNLSVYDVISTSGSYQIDIISNDAFFSDQFLNSASKLTALNYTNGMQIKDTLKAVEDDYDFCILDCPPGKSLLHDNIFNAADLMLIPNVPSPLSVYCFKMLLQYVQTQYGHCRKVAGFYNMVQLQKKMHRHYVQEEELFPGNMLQSHIPFYSEIEAINFNRQSLFHQIKNGKTVMFFEQLFMDICKKLQLDIGREAGIIMPIFTEMPVDAEFEARAASL